MWSSFDARRAKRIMDGVTFGAAWVFAIGLLFAINRMFPIPIMENMAKADFGSVALIFAFSFAAGFVLGFCLIAPICHAASLRFARNRMTSSRGWAHA